MVDGYALIAINEDGSKSTCVERSVFDVRLENLEFYQLEDQLTPDGLKDCLVMVFFKYKSVRSSGWEYVEYEDRFFPVSHVVVQDGYKEFWREQISIEVTYNGYKDYPSDDMTEEEEQWTDEMIEEWETLYNEDFKVHPKWSKENKKDREDEANVQLLMNIIQ
ncbi:hypothetical protein [Paenibacillus dendritiformis]|uniref:hypothetical protein n=1 Tax=Paenibacillus dendritiformis TaxID=130049 RepID=UPI00387E0F7C